MCHGPLSRKYKDLMLETNPPPKPKMIKNTSGVSGTLGTDSGGYIYLEGLVG